MKLIGPIIASGAIVLTVWGVALLQPMPAIAITNAQVTKLSEPESRTQKDDKQQIKVRELADTKSVTPTLISLNKQVISGNTARLATNNVESLWQDFNANITLNSALVKQPKAVYVFYREFSSNFETATITIGYPIEALSAVKNSVTIESANYATVLNRKKYTTTELADGWQQIDYRRPIKQVIEIHHLSSNSTVLSTELLVNYGE